MADTSVPPTQPGSTTPLSVFWSATAAKEADGSTTTVSSRDTGHGIEKVVTKTGPNGEILFTNATSPGTPGTTLLTPSPPPPTASNNNSSNSHEIHPSNSVASEDSSSSSDHKLSPGQIAGIVLCLLAVVIAVGLLIRYWMIRRRQKRQKERFGNWAPPNPPTATRHFSFWASTDKDHPDTEMAAAAGTTATSNHDPCISTGVTAAAVMATTGPVSSVSQGKVEKEKEIATPMVGLRHLPADDPSRLASPNKVVQVQPPPTAVIATSPTTTFTLSLPSDTTPTRKSLPRTYLVDSPKPSDQQETTEESFLDMSQLFLPTSPSFEFSFAEETLDLITALPSTSPGDSAPLSKPTSPTSPTTSVSSSSSDTVKNNSSRNTRSSLIPPPISPSSSFTDKKTKRPPSSASVMSKQAVMFESAPMPRAALRVINRHSRDTRV